MASNQGLQKRLQDEIRKRQAKQRPQAIATGNVGHGRWEEITSRHPDVLQNIEFALVSSWQENEAIDDSWLHLALKTTMLNDQPDHPVTYGICRQLCAIRELRDDLDPELWLDALRVVDQSVRDHSSLRRGDRSYLTFIFPFVAPALARDGDDYLVVEGQVSLPALPAPHHSTSAESTQRDDD